MNSAKISGLDALHLQVWPKENGHWKLSNRFTRRAGSGSVWRLARRRRQTHAKTQRRKGAKYRIQNIEFGIQESGEGSREILPHSLLRLCVSFSSPSR